MAIENFTQAEFEAALPKHKETGAPLWTCNGVDAKTQQITYTVTVNGDYHILVWSSLKATGASTAEAGKDSIRAVITCKGTPYGGKSSRWIDRRKGWQRRLMEDLRALANQIRHVKAGCPNCGQPCVPFTAKTAANKGRAFVACKNADCPQAKLTGKDGFFAWCESEDGSALEPMKFAPTPPPVVETPASPDCPACGVGMVRMSKGKGWRCSKAGRYDVPSRTWSGCQGVIWDNARPVADENAQMCATMANNERNNAGPSMREVESLARSIKWEGSLDSLREEMMAQAGEQANAEGMPRNASRIAPEPRRPAQTPQPSPAPIRRTTTQARTVSVDEVNRIIAELDDDNLDEVRRSLRAMLP